MDQQIALVLGRPPGIASVWVSARVCTAFSPLLMHQFPSLCADDMISDLGISEGPPCHRKESFLQHIQLRMIQAEIFHRLFTVTASKTAPPDNQWFDDIKQRLDLWRSSYDSHPDELITPQWLDLHYNFARQLLYRPNPGNPYPTQASLRQAVEAASAIMRRYKIIWRAKTVTFIWVAIHHVFVAGVTYLNSIWIAARQGWTVTPSLVDAVLDIQACSQILEAMTGELVLPYVGSSNRGTTRYRAHAGCIRGRLGRRHTPSIGREQ